MDQTQDNSIIDLNRSLPALPLKLCLDLPPHLTFKPPSQTVKPPSQTVKPPSQTVRLHERLTSSPSSSSNSSSKQQFRTITRDMLRPFRTESPSPTPSDHLDPVKYNPSDTNAEMPMTLSASQSYGEVADLNPFLHYHDSSFEDASPERRSSQADESMEVKPLQLYPKPKGMSQSRSESHINYCPAPLNIRSHYQREARDEFRDQSNFGGNLDSPPLPSPVRGRSIRRTPSPAKLPPSARAASPSKLDDIKEDQPADCLLSPTKRSRSPVKQLFGEHGWLGKSASMKELPSEQYRKTGIKHWGGKLKQRVGEMTEDVSKKLLPVLSPPYPGSPPSTTEPTTSASPSNLPPKTKFPVSLSPPEQARLFSELELMICATANEYLQTQHHFHRMSPPSVAKVAQTWVAKNRPQVLEFMYDQQTQRDLVAENLKTFRFYGPHAENVVALNSMMLAWKQLGKDMSVRTFCTPDSVVRKQLHDCHTVLEMMGAPLPTFMAFQRLQLDALQRIRDRITAREEYNRIQWGVEKAWEPRPAEMVPDEENPFLHKPASEGASNFRNAYD